MAFDRKKYQREWYVAHKKPCKDCRKLIKFNSTRCKSCETSRRWREGLMPEMKANSGSFKKGQRTSPETEFRKGNKPWNKGIEWKEMSGEKHPNWQGGKTSKVLQIRHSFKYKMWRESIMKRDNYICQICEREGGNLQVDHIKSFARYPELRFKKSNARTLCLRCHKETDNYLWRALYGN